MKLKEIDDSIQVKQAGTATLKLAPYKCGGRISLSMPSLFQVREISGIKAWPAVKLVTLLLFRTIEDKYLKIILSPFRPFLLFLMTYDYNFYVKMERPMESNKIDLDINYSISTVIFVIVSFIVLNLTTSGAGKKEINFM